MKEDELNKLVEQFLNKHKNFKFIPLTKEQMIIISLLETLVEIRKSFNKNFPEQLLKICKEFENEQKA